MSRSPDTANSRKTANPMLDNDLVQADRIDTDEAGNSGNEIPKVNMRPTYVIIACGIVGLCVGIALANGRGSPELISWFKLPGDLFIRALKCVVLPLVFVNIILAIVDMVRAGKASNVGVKTIGLYFLTTLLAAIEGLIFVLMFKNSFSKKDVEDDSNQPEIKIRCPMDFDSYPRYLTEESDGSLRCLMESTVNNANSVFEIDNVNDYLLVNEDDAPEDDITFSETLQDGIFRKLVSDNIVNEFIIANFVGVIVFAIVFGASSQALARQPKVVLELLEECNRIFLTIVDWIIFLTPIAVFSLIAGNIGEQEELSSVFADIGFLMACTFLAMSVHFFIVYPVMFYFFVRESPFKYMKFIVPAQIFAFASASSAATLPLSIDCVRSTKQVPMSIANFVLSMGSTLNMDGGAIYFPTAIVFLGISSGLEDKLDGAAFFMILLLSTIGSAGTAPVPSASLVLIITAYNTVFDETGTPEAFGLILAVDWLMDRFRTLLNVTGDTYMARIVTAVSNVTDEDDKILRLSIAEEEFQGINNQFK